MQIRPARGDEIEEIAQLWCDAFPGDRTVEDRSRMLEEGGPYGGVETVLVAREADGTLAAACKIYRLTQHVTGVPAPMMGLAAVAVRPSRRRRGVGRVLCTEALRAAAERGDVLSALYPFRPDYYRRMGWELVGALHEYRLRTHHLPDYAEADAVREALGTADAEALAACYARAAERGHGPIRRDRRIWAYRLTGMEIGVRPLDVDGSLDLGRHPLRRTLVFQADQVRGYALVQYAPAASPEEGTLLVRELIAETEAAYRGLIGHLRAQADQWPYIRHFARPQERLEERLRDPRPPRFRPARSLYFPTARILRGPMLRLVDLPAALRLRRWFDAPGAENESLTFRIEMEDPDLPHNRGPWRVRIEGAAATVEPAGDAAPVEAALTAGAAPLARIYAGELTVSDALRTGLAEVRGEPAALDRAFGAREPFWLLDEF